MVSKKKRNSRWLRLIIALIWLLVVGLIVVKVGYRLELNTPTPTIKSVGSGQAVARSKVETVTEVEELVIEPSLALEMIIPLNEEGVGVEVAGEVKPLDNCRQGIYPPNNGDIYNCVDFALPGTSSPSTVILTGHSSRWVDTALNALSRQTREELLGREVWIRTEASENRWLIYDIMDVVVIAKPDLAASTYIWGEQGQSTAGRLLIITCLPDSYHASAKNNFVVIGQYRGVYEPLTP